MASDDVGTELREMQILFGDALQSALQGESLTSSIQTVFFTPIVTRPGIGPFSQDCAEPGRSLQLGRGKPPPGRGGPETHGLTKTRAAPIHLLSQ